ncbi:MAG: ComEA family DNA-binding protein [Firmicutes bacterium]|nr:ComEA family DNA-binding protein [Bacillota bacterium]
MFELTVRQKIAILVLLALLAVGGCLLYIFGSRPYIPVSGTPDRESKIYVQVSGAVMAPGVYTVTAGSRKMEAVKLAGGAEARADLSRVNLAEFIEDGEQIYVPKKGEALPEMGPKPKRSRDSTVGKKPAPKPKSKTTPTPPGPWNLNTATREQLEAVPGIGPALAARIIQFRTEQGLFQRYEDLQKVPGIGPAKLEKFRPYLFVP